jgi:hypothetical protein
LQFKVGCSLFLGKLVPGKEVVVARIWVGASVKDLAKRAKEFDNCRYIPAIANEPLGIFLFVIVDSGPLLVVKSTRDIR